MFRYKLNKKQIVIAAMVILLCLVCLSGATLALFTSESSGVIGIIATSGDLDVDVVDAVNTEQSLVGSYLEFQTTLNQNDFRFEPGAIVVTQGFKVRNRGSIPINFRITLNEDLDDGSGNFDADKFNQAFEIWIAKNTVDLATAQKPTEFVDSLDSYECGDDIYYLIIRMKEDADNTYQNYYCTGIGITVCAVQGNVEIEE